MAGRAIVALQPDHGGVGKVALEAEDVFDLGAAPAVDRLVVVADAAEIAPLLGEQAQPQILDDVGVLIFVDQDVAETVLVALQHFRLLAEQAQRFQQQVAEIDRVERLQPLLISLVELGAERRWRSLRLAGADVGGRQAAVLPVVDGMGERAGGPALLVDVLGLEELLEQAELVVGVEDGEIGLEARPVRRGGAGSSRRSSGMCPSTAGRRARRSAPRCARASRARPCW